MEGYQTDIQALLEDVSGNYADPEVEQPPQPPLPYSRPIPNSYKSQADRSMVPRDSLAPIYKQQPLYEAQASRPSDAYSYSTYNNTGLDAYDRALLAEPRPRSQWQPNRSRRMVPAGRISLPGHTAPHSPVDEFQQPEAQKQRRAAPEPSPHKIQSQCARYAYTIPARIHASSPASDALPSSPSFVASQRRIHHEGQRDDPRATIASSWDRRPVASSLRDPEEGTVHEYHVSGIGQDNSFSAVPSPTPYQRRPHPQIRLGHTQPMVQGIPLVSLNELPDRLRSVFRYPLFNAIQSKCFPTAYKSNDNLVVSAPTGGGKTAILEMAICRLIHGFNTDQYKVVYMAPTKSLCSERQRDWQAKFVTLNLQCAELTGDTDQGQLRNVQSASIVITTPEKWDSMTRKWKDQARLMQMVKLFLIDEVHILKDSRGATLEAVVSRMKSVGSNVRFVALSATVPNSEDIATWLAFTCDTREIWRGVQDPELKSTLNSGVAYHHAGLEGPDRHAVEKGFLEGQINVICCTSTLAVGVNLPCHMVIIKNTVSYQDDGIKEYADLEIMQMLGRAGRPQFDSTAVAVIITKQEKVEKYERLVSGKELLESCLHLNLIDHLNAEIGLGTIYNLYTAKRWLAGTFLYVRLGLNPEHYKLDGDAVAQNLDDRIERICRRDLELLEDTDLVTSGDRLKATEFGDAMARYYVKFETMRVIMRLQPRSKISDILSAIVQAEEFREIRLRANEKKVFKEINRANGVKFPIKVDLAMHAHKRSLIIQSELGGVDFPADEQYAKHKRQFTQDKANLFSASHRLIRCLIDCQIHLQDAVTVRHALELATSFGARVWDNSPYQMKQVAQIGLVAVRKLAMGGINSIEALEAAEPHRIEMLMSKNPPFGNKLLANLRDFPKLRVSMKMMGKDSTRRPVTIKIKAECGFMNDTVPVFFNRRPIYICLLTERSDGFLVDFRRISAKTFNNDQHLRMSAVLLNQTQYITCYIMCDGIAGTTRSAELRPELPAFLFPPPSSQKQAQQFTRMERDTRRNGNISEQQGASTFHTSPETLDDEFGDDDFKDQEVMKAVQNMDFAHIDEFDPGSKQRELEPSIRESKASGSEQVAWNPERLGNGKWACNHKCKDKTACKHMCCREGVDKAPKPPKGSFVSTASLVESSHVSGYKGQSGRIATANKSAAPCEFKNEQEADIETANLACRQTLGDYEKTPPKTFRSLDRLHEIVTKGRTAPVAMKKRPSFDYTKGGQPQISFLNKDPSAEKSSDKASTDYDADWMGDLPSPSALLGKLREKADPHVENTSTDYGSSWPDGLPSPSALIRQNDAATESFAANDSLEGLDLSPFNDDGSDLEAAMVGLSDSVTMQEDSQVQAATGQTSSQAEAFTHWSPPPDQSAPKLYRRPTFKTESSGTSKLFLSSDNPEKVAEQQQPQKRKVSVGDQVEDLSRSAPVPKRPRVSDDQAPRPWSSVETQAKPGKPIIKAGQPAWVYELDAAFVAEWQDVVDFV